MPLIGPLALASITGDHNVHKFLQLLVAVPWADSRETQCVFAPTFMVGPIPCSIVLARDRSCSF